MILAIYGTGGLGRIIYDLIIADTANPVKWDKVVFINDYSEERVCNTDVYTYENLKKTYSKDEVGIIISLGDPSIREKIYNKIKADGYKMATVTHSGAHISPFSTIGEGCYVFYSSLVGNNVHIGNNVIICPNASISHDINLGDHCIIQGNCVVGGHVNIGDKVFMAVGSCTRDCVNIGSNSVISLGASIFKDVKENSVAIGNPARVSPRDPNVNLFETPKK